MIVIESSSKIKQRSFIKNSGRSFSLHRHERDANRKNIAYGRGCPSTHTRTFCTRSVYTYVHIYYAIDRLTKLIIYYLLLLHYVFPSFSSKVFKTLQNSEFRKGTQHQVSFNCFLNKEIKNVDYCQTETTAFQHPDWIWDIIEFALDPWPLLSCWVSWHCEIQFSFVSHLYDVDLQKSLIVSFYPRADVPSIVCL